MIHLIKTKILIDRPLEPEEERGIYQAAKILSEAFKRKIFGMTVNPIIGHSQHVYGISFSFNIMDIKNEKKD